MKNNEQNNQNQVPVDVLVAKLALFGATLTTKGDGIAALAAGIALQELEKSKSQNSTD
ncbi:hypothetical protein MKX96_12460 [Psychrobacillus sp. FSL W7-1493]|uniref:hypothetical protein n=1 Tax=unclassified Psychrobacillus TaxID=2636677 RepID=UPI00203E3239|nr:hypothetical protein [Psychrobacillus sp. MER TA 171]MCM3359790.1 hypothetical protein [Psychrobacillus sp. MER TA 171]